MGSQTSSKELSKSDLKERIGMLIPWCVQFLITEGIYFKKIIKTFW